MQNKTVLLVLFYMLLGTIGLVAVAGAGNLQSPTEEIVIKGDKKSARFAHSVHIEMGIICGTCHHDANHEPYSRKAINVMENSNPLRCNSCHNANFANSMLNSRKMAFHAHCKECHKKGFNGKNGPRKCNGCHVKKKK